MMSFLCLKLTTNDIIRVNNGGMLTHLVELISLHDRCGPAEPPGGRALKPWMSYMSPSCVQKSEQRQWLGVLCRQGLFCGHTYGRPLLFTFQLIKISYVLLRK